MRGLPRPTSLAIALILAGCANSVPPFGASEIDRSVSEPSQYPLAVDPSLVGTYPGESKSGGGYLWDEVLEYRVWLHPERGAPDLASGSDYFAAFAQFEAAARFSDASPGAEMPLVLIRQFESIDEPNPGVFHAVREERITEWQPAWLVGNKRGPNSIEDFLRNPPPPGE